jgi:hypothetical protein
MALENDYLIRNINELATAIRVLMGLLPGEEDLNEIEVEAESHLGMPLNLLEGMTQPALLSFVTMQGGPEPRRTMLLGLVLAARAEMAAENDEHARVADLRPKAITLLQTAFDLEERLRTDEIVEVWETMLEEQAEA